MIIPKIEHFGSKPTTAGLVTLSASDAGTNPEHVKRGIAWLESRDVKVKWAPNALATGSFLAAPPEALANDLHEMLIDEEVDWILTTGGGANANALLPWLRPEVLKKHPKPIIGLSNSTVLLNPLSAASGVVTFHGPVLIWNLGNEIPIDEYTEDHFRRALNGTTPITVEPEPCWKWLQTGTARGRCWGGNLWSFQQLLGTQYLPNLNGAVLFLEECFTELHNVEAMLTHLRHAGVLENLSGLIVGQPLECIETEMPDGRGFEQIVADACATFSFPILANVSLGHTDRKITTPIGGFIRLDSTTNELVFEGQE